MLVSFGHWQRLVIASVLVFATQSAAVQSQEFQRPAAEATAAEAIEGEATEGEATEGDDWARQFLKDDPLAALPQVTLEDLRGGLEDSRQRSSVIARHFWRVTGATDQEKIDFLIQAMRSPLAVVQRQAAVELQAMNALESVVRDLLLEYLTSEDPVLRRASVVGLELIEIPPGRQSEGYWSALIEALGDPDDTVAESAARQLKDQGAGAAPALLDALREQHPRQLLVARVLSEIVGGKSIRIDSIGSARSD